MNECFTTEVCAMAEGGVKHQLWLPEYRRLSKYRLTRDLSPKIPFRLHLKETEKTEKAQRLPLSVWEKGRGVRRTRGWSRGRALVLRRGRNVLVDHKQSYNRKHNGKFSKIELLLPAYPARLRMFLKSMPLLFISRRCSSRIFAAIPSLRASSAHAAHTFISIASVWTRYAASLLKHLWHFISQSIT